MIAFLLTTLLLHPVHETFSEVEWNAETGRLEVALRLDPLDEQWLRKKYAASEELSRWAPRYLRDRFRITEKPKSDREAGEQTPATDSGGPPGDHDAHRDDTATYHWIGRQEGKSHVWWYFEIEPIDQQPPRWIDVRLLWERDDRYMSRVLSLGQTPRRALTCTRVQPRVLFDSAHESIDSPPADRGSHFDR